MANPFDEPEANPFDMPPEDAAMRARELNASAVGKAEGEGEAALDKPTTDVADATRGARAGLAQGLSRGFSDEMEGALNAALAVVGVKINDRNDLTKGLSPTHPDHPLTWEELGKAYTDARNARRGDIAEAQDAQPIQYGVGDVAGSMVGPGAGGTTKLARAGYGLLNGGVSALGHSNADLTKGDVGDAAKDTLGGAGVGAVANVLGGVVGDKFSEQAARAQAAGRSAMQKIAEKGLRSTTGALGGETSSANRAFEVLKNAVDDETLPAAERAAAAARLAEPDMVALAPQIVRSNIARSYGQSNRIADARDAMTAAAEKTTPEAIDEATKQSLSPDAARRAIMSRASTMAQRFGPSIAMGALGAHAGGTTGALLGGVGGAVVGAMHGRPGTILANALQNPAVQYNGSKLAQYLAQKETGAAVNTAGESQSNIRGALAHYLDDEENQPHPWSSLTSGDDNKQ